MGDMVLKLRTTLFFVTVVAIAISLTIWLVSQPQPLMGLQIALSILLVVLCGSLDFARDRDLPFLIRPASAVTASVIVGSIAAPTLGWDQYRDFMILWVCLVIGVILGVLATQSDTLFEGRQFRAIDRSLLVRLSKLTLIVSAFSAGAFFAWQGIPALGGNVEQGRVDAAVSGSGYLRLVAYLSIPAVHMLFAARHRLAVPALCFSLLVILGLANRSPLLYLFVPLLLVFGAQKRFRLSSMRIIGAVAIAAVLVLSIGTFRVFSEDQFVRYDEYRVDLSTGNYLGVATTTLTQYAEVVADNAVLTKTLVDEGAIPLKFGSTYITLFISAFPGEQLSLDRLIKQTSGASFVGGGTPPTLMGEAYVNFGIPGVIGIGIFVVGLLRYWSDRYRRSVKFGDPLIRDTTAGVYGYMLCWVVGSPVAGLAGASTLPLAGAILIVLLRSVSMRYVAKPS
jgi:oligosaccharide repeat unit polymerase